MVFKESIARRQTIPQEALPHYWHPNRPDSRLAPEWFRAKVKQLGQELEVCWSPMHERWLVWMRKPRVTHRLCPGWWLLFVHQTANREYLPLDERLLARIESCSVKADGSARKHFDRIAAEIERDRQRADEQWRQDTLDMALPFYDYSQIKISMAGPSNGSKFATYLS